MTSDVRLTDERRALAQRIIESRAVAVVRMTDSSRLISVVSALRDGGLISVEITMTVPNALQLIEDVAGELGDSIILGVGSVLDAATAQRAIDAGARYVVSPIFKTEVIDAAHRNGCPVMPGAFSPTEVLAAQEYGADVVKVFPADVVGMAFFKAVLAPMPHLRMMPTGGVTLDNAGDWIRAGAVAVGVGGALLDKDAVAAGDYDVIRNNARRLMASVQSV